MRGSCSPRLCLAAAAHPTALQWLFCEGLAEPLAQRPFVLRPTPPPCHGAPLLRLLRPLRGAQVSSKKIRMGEVPAPDVLGNLTPWRSSPSVRSSCLFFAAPGAGPARPQPPAWRPKALLLGSAYHFTAAPRILCIGGQAPSGGRHR